MKPTHFDDLDAQMLFLNEYLRNGGIEQIMFPDLIQDIRAIQFTREKKAIPSTVSSRVRAFINGLLATQIDPPPTLLMYETFLQKEQYFEQEFIEDQASLDRIFEQLKSKKSLLFRGQGEAKWRLFSTIQRELHEKELTPELFKNLLTCLIENAKVAYRDEIQQALGADHVDSLNNMAVLGFLQHHHCPTPLLDWTYDIYNALYFALDGIKSEGSRQIDQYFSIYYINEHEFEKGSLRNTVVDYLNEIEPQALEDLIDKLSDGDADLKAEMLDKFKGRKVFDLQKVSSNGLINRITNLDFLFNLKSTYFGDNDEEYGLKYSLRNNKIFSIKKEHSHGMQVLTNHLR